MTGPLSCDTSGNAARSTLTTSSSRPRLNPRAKGLSVSETRMFPGPRAYVLSALSNQASPRSVR